MSMSSSIPVVVITKIFLTIITVSNQSAAFPANN